ncbi:MAG: 1-deoxy-D-xylulose-5-phosphate reductoisomerase [Desulfovibrionaceae bacterium]
MASYISPLHAASLSERFPRPLVILGSTGSIGTSALKVLAQHPRDFVVVGLAGARNVQRLADQAARWRPSHVAVIDGDHAAALQKLLPKGYAPEILTGPEGYVAMATLPQADMVLAAQVGAAGLAPALAAVTAGKALALANKEALVLAGDLFRAASAATGAPILPVDSEHNALFQGLAGHGMNDVRRIILTASGGPFRGKGIEFLRHVTPEQALRHPNWSMGAKITIDSATLMNKGLEVIEAHHLYGMPLDAIEVVVHPQSIVHSLVEYRDRSQLAHLGPPDMQIAIAYCLAWPRRLPLDMEPLDLARVGSLTFESPDIPSFPCLGLAMEALRRKGAAPVALNAANEVAVAAFLDRSLGFMDIPALISRCMDEVRGNPAPPDLETILALDHQVRARARAIISEGAFTRPAPEGHATRD